MVTANPDVAFSRNPRLGKTPFTFPVQPKKLQQQTFASLCSRRIIFAAALLIVLYYVYVPDSLLRYTELPPASRYQAAHPYRVPIQQSPAAKDLLSTGSACSKDMATKLRFRTSAANDQVVGALRLPQQPPENSTIWRRPVILLLGDSLTELGQDEGGWGVKMAAAYKRKADVINRGFAGFNTAITLLGLSEITEQMSQHQVVFATVWLGANDAAIPGRRDGKAHVPIDHYRLNLVNIIEQLTAAGVRNIIMMTPPPVFEGAPQAIEPGQPPARTYNTSQPYAAAVRVVARNHPVLLLDIWQLFKVQKGWQQQLLGPDGLHLSAAGHAAVYQAVMRLVEQKLPGFR
eukprot:GHUV01027291.1.p1 GENE.GHUV01027291.1~~GHUV01027291.1.p1  ORF type:complete len:346 (+),score=67.66 GHUV01027291.1:496-1533(+)